MLRVNAPRGASQLLMHDGRTPMRDDFEKLRLGVEKIVNGEEPEWNPYSGLELTNLSWRLASNGHAEIMDKLLENAIRRTRGLPAESAALVRCRLHYVFETDGFVFGEQMGRWPTFAAHVDGRTSVMLKGRLCLL